MKCVYPATFTPTKNGGYTVVFPDFESCFTEGKDIADALFMARDVLAVYIDTLEELKQSVPKASLISSVPAPEGGFVAPVDIDLSAYRRKRENRSVKRTISLPSWMATVAEEAGLSLSQVVQDGIRTQLSLHER